MGRRNLELTLTAAILALTLAGSAHGGECDAAHADLRGYWGVARFSVEIADEPDERAQGLMHRTEMATTAGMLFVYDTPQRASFWMSNTLIPLDLIFADETGLVTRVHHNAVPGDLSSINGGDNILIVLEINGGLAEQYGIEAGSQMRHHLLDSAHAVWPCPASQ